MAEAIVADTAAGLVRKLASLVAEEVIQAWNLDEDLETLRERFEIVGALLHDAYTKKLSISTAQKWFNKLEDVANVTEAFMDELAYEVTRRNVENSHKVWDSFIPSKNTLLYRFKVARKIKSINASFDNICKLAGDLGLHAVEHLNYTIQPRDIRTTPSFEDKTFVVGRDKDISSLVQNVCKNNEQDLNVVAIVGMGGQGKTTLARMVFNSNDVINMFPKRMWITISDDFNLISILNEMVESLVSTKSDLKNPQGLVNELHKIINGEKFLLVLDDVWNEESVKWEDLRNSLIGVSGAKGSSVIVTTRNQEVIDGIKNCVPYPLEKLQEDISYELFKTIAFQDGGVLEIEPFVDLGRSMVKRCGGLPLAIKALGGLLRSKKYEQEWRKIHNSETWTSKDVLSSLRLSYDNLPYSSLKRCFVYCSIIPKDSVIYKDELVQIWMALGFLLPIPGTDALMEDIGSEYFNILLWHSLLQDIERDEFGNIERCRMHDLVHDLALDLSKHYSVNIKTGHELNHVSKATYLRLNKRVSDRNPKIIKRNLEKVRLLHAGAWIFGDVLPYIAHLTVLVLNTDRAGFKDAAELPKSLRNMKYIKHLDISYLDCELPSYITDLYNLQTLKVWTIKELPKKFCNLINLRHLYFTKPIGPSRCIFYGIARLTCLQTLPYFVVSKDKKCLIGQLKGLHNLRGEVKLYGLSDVSSMEEASKAKLYKKSNIQSLLLNWKTDEDERVNSSEEECVFNGLEPHGNLKELMIEYFMGKRFPSWITKMTNLVKIKLSDCERCEEIPSLGHLSQLRNIIIQRMANVIRIIWSDCGDVGKVKTLYPSLTKLILWDLPKLEEWLELDTSRVSADQVFPKLEVLEIKSCSKLRTMRDSCFSSLKSLTINDFDSSKVIVEAISIKVSSLTDLEIRKGHIGTGGGGSSCLNTEPVFEELLKNNSQTLTHLKLRNCQGFSRLTVGAALERLEVDECPDLTILHIVEDTCCLRFINIKKCPSLTQFSQSVISTIERLDVDEIPRWLSSSVISFPNLIEVTLIGYGKVISLEFDDHLVSAFPALTRLYITSFKGLKALPDTIAKLPSLEELHIWICRELESLPTFNQSHSIQLLEMRWCGIMKERCKKDSGPEWFKIQHIPRLRISINILKAHGKSAKDSYLPKGYALSTGRAAQGMPMTMRVAPARIACLDFNLQKTKMQMGVQVLVSDRPELEKI
ncbi:NB-ARC domain-containing protein [Heracleum sosnowskyi]|uniref:NB-ARC domain-containing protein n=1 Tax=Heracleum sosnowskyi TaxID=360622 RepID=A0AAD8N3Z4_9APIA|nr:NB-ARC domain-containing protein [Heracleum sosnowskyi]